MGICVIFVRRVRRNDDVPAGRVPFLNREPSHEWRGYFPMSVVGHGALPRAKAGQNLPARIRLGAMNRLRHQVLVLFLSLSGLGPVAWAQGFDIAPFYILSADVVPDSVRLVRFNTNIYAVRWTYTEAGAQKLLAFNEAHAGQRACKVVGNYETRSFEVQFAPTPAFTNYAAWKVNWLQHRTDKFFGLNETEATAIAAALRYGDPKFRCLSLTNPAAKPAGNLTAGSVKGVLTDPNFRMVIHALEQRSGFETLAEPEVTTTSGRGQNSIRIPNLVWNITAPVTNPPPASAK